MPAQPVIRVPDAVQSGGLTLLVAKLAIQLEGLLTVRQGGAGVAQVGVAPADVVEGIGLAGPIAAALQEVEGLVAATKRLAVVALALPRTAEVKQYASRSGAAADLTVKVKRTQE